MRDKKKLNEECRALWCYLRGPIGVGNKLGPRRSIKACLAFIDVHSSGPSLRSILKTSHSIVAARLEQLENHPAVIVAYALLCTNWLFYRESFMRRGISCRCVRLIADIAC